MHRLTFAVALCCCAMMLSGEALAAPNVQPGRWEITSSIDMPGMAFAMPASKHTQCIGDTDLIPQAQQTNDKCQMLDNRVDGDTVTWKVICTSGGGTMTSSGTVVYHGDRFEGTIITTGTQMPAGMTQKMSGQRIGDCR